MADIRDDLLIARLQKPSGPVDVVLDTDAYNEIDDQYALAYLLQNSAKLTPKGIYAAPFLNGRVTSAAEGMQKSYDEIHNILRLTGHTGLAGLVQQGSTRFLRGEAEPVPSAAAQHLAALAMSYTPQRPLYVVAIAALTNIASALLINPDIASRIVVVWLGGHAPWWAHNKEFNMMQDVASARVVFGSGAALVQLPCAGVVSAFATTRHELQHWLAGKNDLCDYLIRVTCDEAVESRRGKLWSKPIWDVTAVAWLLDGDFMQDRLLPAPIPEYDHQWAYNGTRHLIRQVYHIHRDRLFADLFAKLGGTAP